MEESTKRNRKKSGCYTSAKSGIIKAGIQKNDWSNIKEANN